MGELEKESVKGLEGRPAVARVKAQEFIKNPTLHEEIFGPFTLLVTCANFNEMEKVAGVLNGQLTVTLLAEKAELSDNTKIISKLREKAGRVLFGGVPTGVEVCSSMQHGGPFPATTDSRFTSVGAAAIKRFVRPVSFQNWPDELLPAELQNANPLKIWRSVNNNFGKNAI